MAHDVFISYASKDKKVADAVCSYMENERIRCWIAPRDITPGKKYAQDIVDAIKDCRVMVVIFSSSANESEHVSAEVERAMNRGIIIIPFRIENVTPTGEMEYYLGNRHWLEAITIPMEQHIQRLVKTIQTVLGNSPPANADAPPAAPKKRRSGEGKKKRSPVIPIAVGTAVLLLAVGVAFRHQLFPDRAGAAVGGQNGGGSQPDSAQTSTPKITEAPAGDQPVVIRPSNLKAEIIDGLLADGWISVQLENRGETADFHVIVNAFDDDGNAVDIQSMQFSQVASKEIRKSSLPLSGNSARVELYILEDYGDTAKIQEQTLADGWVQLLLANGGENGSFHVIVKGLDAEKRVVDFQSVLFSEMQKREVRKSSIPVSGSPVTFESYIVRDYGNGPKILEYELIDGWASVLLANGGDEDSFNVAVKGYDAQGKVVASENMSFSSMQKHEVRKSSFPLSGNPVKIEVFIR